MKGSTKVVCREISADENCCALQLWFATWHKIIILVVPLLLGTVTMAEMLQEALCLDNNLLTSTFNFETYFC